MDDLSELARLHGVGSVVYPDPEADQDEIREVFDMFGDIEEEVNNDSSRIG